MPTLSILQLILAGTLVLVPPTALPTHERQAKLTDANVVAIFDAANTFDIETGTLAATKASATEVRELGKQFAEAHRNVRQQGRDLARKLGITPMLPKGDQGAAQHEAAMKELKAKQGAEFDRGFLAHEIAFHQAVIDGVTSTLLPAAQNPELRKFIEGVAPAFNGHLQQAKAVQEKVVAAAR